MAEPATTMKQRGGWRPLTLRIASAVVLGPIALAAVWLGEEPFLVLIALAAGVMAYEWQRVTFGTTDLRIVFTVVLVTAGAGYYAGEYWEEFWGIAALAGGAVAVAAGLLMVRGRHPALWSALGAVYIIPACVAIIWLRAEPEAGREMVFWLLLLVWATDIGAYAAGRTIGGPKLWPQVSPNKTWAGLLGGTAAAGIVGAVMARASGLAPVAELALTSMLLAVVSQGGDLAESAWKRHFGVKDSGSSIPGHGGLLDRVDGLLFATLGAAMMALVNGGRLLPWD